PAGEELVLARRAGPLFLQPRDLRQLGLRLLGLALLVAEPLDETLQPGDVLTDPLGRPGRGGRAGRLLSPPHVPAPRDEERAPGERVERPVEIAIVKAEPAQRPGCPLPPVVAAGVLEPGLRLGVTPERSGAMVAARHRLLERAQLLFGLDEVARPAQRVFA